MLRNGINCIKFYWFGIFCSAIICIVVSTFLDYRVLFSKGDFYTWRVSFTIVVISVTVSDIIMLQVTMSIVVLKITLTLEIILNLRFMMH